MIVKVQISQFSSDGISRMLIYDETRTVHFEGQATKEVLKVMKKQPKKYFTAKLVGTEIEIDQEVKNQNW